MKYRCKVAREVFHLITVIRCTASLLTSLFPSHASSLALGSTIHRSQRPYLANIKRWLVTTTASSRKYMNINDCRPAYDEMERCWNSDSWSVNPLNVSAIDDILKCLNSPAPQSFFVIKRAIRMSKQNGLPIADTLQGFGYLVKPGFQLVITNTEIQRRDENFLPWGVLSLRETVNDGWQSVPRDTRKDRTVLEMSSQMLSVAMKTSEKQQPVHKSFLGSCAEEALVSCLYSGFLSWR